MHTFHTEDALRSIFSLTRIVCHIHIHRTDLLTFSTGYTGVLVTFYTNERKIAKRLHQYSNRTDIFTEYPVILQHKSHDDSNGIIKDISSQETPEHNPLNITHLKQKKHSYKNESGSKYDIADKSKFFLSPLDCLYGRKSSTMAVQQAYPHHPLPK